MRQYLGYNRFDRQDLTEQLNTLYTTEWRLLMNFFMSSTKLVEKYRDRDDSEERRRDLRVNPSVDGQMG